MLVSIVGGSGYTGGELLRLLLGHPHLTVHQVMSRTFAGKRVSSVHPNLRGQTEAIFANYDEIDETDILVLALPHGESSRGFEKFQKLAPIIVDMAADFRLRQASTYSHWYAWEHPRPELLDSFVYALPELHRQDIQDSDYLATGGCLATATILSLYPLAKAGVIDQELPVTVEAKVGSSAAGAKSGPSTHHPHRSREIRSFAPTGHRHTGEIAQELALSPGQIGFSATAVEAVRGILATSHVYLKDELSEKELWKIYRAAYRDEPFMRIVKEARGLHRYPEPKLLSGTNYCDVGFERDDNSRRVVVMGAIDNLVKGAAGQAVQALNIRLGWDERAGLEFAGLYPL